MNKAFIKEETEGDEGRCPRCKTIGHPVGSETLREHLAPADATLFPDAAFFCPYPGCGTAYFDRVGLTVPVERARGLSYPKNPAGPICSCFGLSRRELDDDLQTGDPRRIRELLQKAQSPEARCAAAAPDGRSCVSEVRKYWMRGRGQ